MDDSLENMVVHQIMIKKVLIIMYFTAKIVSFFRRHVMPPVLLFVFILYSIKGTKIRMIVQCEEKNTV